MSNRNLILRDRNVVWHPFTQSGMNQDPLVVVEATGSRIILESGEELLDGISSWWCNIHGHGHPKLIEAATQQFSTLDHVLFAGCTHEPAVALAEQLLPLLPGKPSKVFYSDNGSTAVEVALKLAIQFWQNRNSPRLKIVALENGYHGDTFGAMAAGARGIFSKPFESLLFEVSYLPTRPCPDDVAAFEELCSTQSVAAFIFEPRVQGAGGMNMYDLKAVDRYMEISRLHGVLCIADEVMTGFGRTGPLFASHELRYPPDMVCLSKALTSGSIPLSVTACSEEIFKEFVSSDHSRTFFHGHTYTANPIACAIALASLELTHSSECAVSRSRIEAAHHACAEKLLQTPYASNVRVAGTIIAYDYQDQQQQGYLNPIRDRAMKFFRERGILLRPLGNVVYSMPPYCTSDAELEMLHQALIDFASSR